MQGCLVVLMQLADDFLEETGQRLVQCEVASGIVLRRIVASRV